MKQIFAVVLLLDLIILGILYSFFYKVDNQLQLMQARIILLESETCYGKGIK